MKNPDIGTMIAIGISLLSFGLSVLTYFSNNNQKKLDNAMSLYRIWNSKEMIQARDATTWILDSKTPLWDLHKAENKEKYAQVYMVLATIDEISILIQKDVIDLRVYGQSIKAGPGGYAREAIKAWPQDVDRDFPNLKYISNIK